MVDRTDPPSAALLLACHVKQSQHDSTARSPISIGCSPASGQRQALSREPPCSRARNYADAQRDCRRLARLTTALSSLSCIAGPLSLSGVADDAYRALAQALARSVDPPGIRAWALTLAAEIAAAAAIRAADTDFREAFSLDPGDAYLRAAYADFLLDMPPP